MIIKVAELADVIKFILAKNQEEILSENCQSKWHDTQKTVISRLWGDWCLIGQKRDCHGKITDAFLEQFEPLFLMSFWPSVSLLPLFSLQFEWEVMLRLPNKSIFGSQFFFSSIPQCIISFNKHDLVALLPAEFTCQISPVWETGNPSLTRWLTFWNLIFLRREKITFRQHLWSLKTFFGGFQTRTDKKSM